MSHHEKLNPGDIVLVVFPYADGKADKPHPALVLDSDNHVVYVAYGTSARIEQAVHISTSVVLMDPADLQTASLHKPTAFHIDRRARIGVHAIYKRLGTLPAHKFRSLYHAAVAAGLMRG